MTHRRNSPGNRCGPTAGLGIGVAEDRERGWLRVKRVSPVPVGTTLAATVATYLPVAFGVYTAMSLTAVAMGTFDTDLGTWLAIASVLLLGSLPFALLGLAVGFTASGRAAPAMINAIFLPMAIARGLWMPIDALPSIIQRIARCCHVPCAAARTRCPARDPVVDHVSALLATTTITAVRAAVAYRTSRR